MYPDMSIMLMPISPENPAGENLEYEHLFDEIRLARESDPDYLPQDEWSVKEPRKADWNKVMTLSEKALTTQTKDLQLACWFVEALSHQQGLTGLSEGIEFLSEFITRFWFQSWPSLKEEGVTMRRSKLLRLDKEVSQQLLHQPLLRQPCTTLILWRQLLAREHNINTQSSEHGEPFDKHGDLTMESFDQQAIHFSSIEIGLQATKVETLAISIAKLEARYQSLSQDTEGELFNLTKQTLADLAEYLQRLTQRAIPLADEVIAIEPVIEDIATNSIEESIQSTQQAFNRELAINQMLAIASYFRQSEPSSPVPFLMERAARWATMTLPEWLEEMLHDNNSINEINNVLTGGPL